MIRPDAHTIILEGLREVKTNDGSRLPDVAHITTIGFNVIDAFKAEGIDLGALVDEAIANQKVTIEAVARG